MIDIQLTQAEILQGAMNGAIREIQNIRLERQQNHGNDNKQEWQQHIEGALGEMALAKHLDVYWSNGTFRGSDVGIHEVRTTPGHNNRLILHAEDHDDSRYYLVTGAYGKYVIRGWILGKDGKDPKFWTDPGTGRPAYFIPQQELNQ